MSYWGGTVITSLYIILPNLIQLLTGTLSIITWNTITRYYIIHTSLGLSILLIILLHIILLHTLITTCSLTIT
jgi:quinol-cytochrome oxidoreductase complex cytochrome b subunit